jgi:hypothetical protein
MAPVRVVGNNEESKAAGRVLVGEHGAREPGKEDG